MNLDAGRRTRTRQFGLGILLVLILVGLRLSSAGNQRAASRINALFATVTPASPGAAVMIVRGGHSVFARGYGVTDLRSLHKIDEHTNFRLASVTKQFTAMAVMLLVHDGKLRYEQTLTDVFPDFPAYGKSITIRHMLNHTSGLVDYEDLMAEKYGDTPDDQIPQIKDAGVLALLEKVSSTKFVPGSKWVYSNSGYCLLAMVVEKVSGESFGEFLQRRIFAPLHMSNTVAFEKGKNEVSDRAYGHTLQNGAWHETDRTRVPRPRHWAMAAFTLRSRTLPAGMPRCGITPSSAKRKCFRPSRPHSPQAARRRKPTEGW